MISLLLAVIYLAFVSLGLPDTLLGSAWPVMYKSLDVPLAFAGIITFIISCGTVVSSLASAALTRRFGAGRVTAVSVMMTASALLGFSLADSFPILCVLAVPYGLGAGGVDAALNNFVAVHFASRHMNWLHCCWGVGAALGPCIMGRCLLRTPGEWHAGYRIVAFIQIALTAVLFLSLPLWKRIGGTSAAGGTSDRQMGPVAALRIAGVREVLVGFFAYCALETTAGLWAGSYLVLHRHMAEAAAAGYTSLVFVGITAGRFLSGFVSNRVGDRNMIRGGLTLAGAGILLLLLPGMPLRVALVSLALVGLGCAPVYPAIIHGTPRNFGANASQAVIGIQMAAAYIGSTVIPPLFGFIARYSGVRLYPWYLLIFGVTIMAALERMNRIVDGTKITFAPAP